MGLTLQLEPLQPQPSVPSTSATVNARLASRRLPRSATSKVVMPVRYSAWLQGDLGRALSGMLEDALGPYEGLQIGFLPRAFVVEAVEDPGPFVEALYRAAKELERRVEERYPVFHHQIGPVWTGTLQSVFA
ncbi:MAG: hypothetical protein V4510_08230 [bacterium]